MPFFYMILILISVYIFLNKKVGDTSKVGWFILVFTFLVLIVVFNLLF